MNEEEITSALQKIASSFGHSIRSPILETPAKYDLEYEDVWFPSEDGVPLEAWFIPRKGSQRLIIMNHPRWFSRYGFPAHLEPWKSIGASTGNDFEVNFMRDYKILHDAGYNTLTYDLRNFGHSGSANGGVTSNGVYESRDVIGSLTYARSRKDLQRMTIGLFSRCLGCAATIFAMARRPDQFSDVKSFIALQPLSIRVIMEKALQRMNIPADRIEELDRGIKLATSFSMDDTSPVKPAKSVTVPTFMYQVHDDLMTSPRDVQAIFDNIPIQDKELFWIRGTTRRWDGYNYFAKDPSKMLAWLDKYMR
jgi:hypothetical protein